MIDMYIYANDMCSETRSLVGVHLEEGFGKEEVFLGEKEVGVNKSLQREQPIFYFFFIKHKKKKN